MRIDQLPDEEALINKCTSFLFFVFFIYYCLNIHNLFFLRDDFHFLSKVMNEPFVDLLFPSNSFFHYRPLTQFGYFKLCYTLFGLDHRGYLMVNLLAQTLNVWLIYRLFKILGARETYNRIACLFLFTSACFFHNLIWISNAQHTYCQTALLLAILSEIRWSHTGRHRYKLLSTSIFAIGLFMNLSISLFLPLMYIVYLYRWISHGKNPEIMVLFRFLMYLLPNIIILLAFLLAAFLFEYGSFLIPPSTFPYTAHYTLKQAATNLYNAFGIIFPLPRTMAFLMMTISATSAGHMLYCLFRKSKSSTLVKFNVFLITWFGISVCMYVFFVIRNEVNWYFLGSVALFYMVVINLFEFVKRICLSEKTRKMAVLVLAVAMFSFQLEHSLNYIKKDTLTSKGDRVKKGLDQIAYLIDFHLPGKKMIYLVRNFEHWIVEPEIFDFGWGLFQDCFFTDRDITFEFMDTQEGETKRETLGKDEAILYYDRDYNFYLEKWEHGI